MRKSAEGGVDSSVVFFLDRNLGHEDVGAALRAQGAQVEEHSKHFPSDAPDRDWLLEVGRRGWAVVTQDDRIRYRNAERTAARAANVALFIFTGKRMRGSEIGTALAGALKKMTRLVRKHKPPFIARVTRTGDVQVIE